METRAVEEVKYPGETVEFRCTFKAKNFKVFTNPMEWRKRQGHPPEGAEEEVINKNALPQPPFDIERFNITEPFETETDCHTYTLSIRG